MLTPQIEQQINLLSDVLGPDRVLTPQIEQQIYALSVVVFKGCHDLTLFLVFFVWQYLRLLTLRKLFVPEFNRLNEDKLKRVSQLVYRDSMYSDG